MHAFWRPPPLPPPTLQGSAKAVSWTLANMVRPGDAVRLLHVVPVPTPEVVGGVGVGGAGDFLVTPPDPRVDAARIQAAEKFIQARFVPALEGAGVPYKAEILHFGTDAESVGSVVAARAKALDASGVVIAKHNKGKIAQFLLGSTAKFLTTHCEVPVVVLHD